MANNYDLLVTIKSDDKNFSKGFRSANNALKKTQHEIKNTGKSYQNLNRAQKQSIQYAKEVAVKYGATSKQFRNAAKNVKAYSREVNKANSAVSKLSNKGRSGGLADSIVGVATRRILPLIAIGAASKAVGDAARVNIMFEKTMSQVEAVSRATNEQMVELEKNARMVGSATPKTASEIAQLEVELSKLGFTADETLSATRGIVDLSIAGFAELDQTAILVAQTLNGFNLSASKTTEVADAMAYAFSNSALDLEKLATGLPNVGTAANKFGWSVQKTIGLLGILSDAGIDASKMGTDLRMIITKLSKDGLTLDQALDKINKSTNKVVTAQELFGQRSFVSALALADQADKVREINSEYEDLDGTARRMSKTMQDNVAGSIDKAKAAWQELILGMQSSKGIVKGVVDSIVRHLDKLNLALGSLNANWVEQEKIMAISNTRGEALSGLKMAWVEGEKNNKVLEHQIKLLKEKLATEEADVKLKKEMSESGISDFAGDFTKQDEQDWKHREEGLRQAIRELQGMLDDEPVNINIGIGGDGSGGGGGADEIIGILNTLNAKLKEAKKLRDEAITPQQIAQQDKVIELLKQEIGYYNGLFQAIKKTAKAIPDTLSSTTMAGGGIAIEGLSFYANPELTIDTTNAEKSITEFGASLDSLIEQHAVSAISESGQWLGEAIMKSAQGVDDAFSGYGQVALGILGDFLVQLGELLIAQGVAIIAAEEAWVSPYVAIAAGAAAVIIGGAISSMAAPDLGSGSSSGSAVPNVSIKPCDGYSQYSTPLGGGSGGSDGGGTGDGMVEFVIKGDALVGVIERNKVRNKNFT